MWTTVLTPHTVWGFNIATSVLPTQRTTWQIGSLFVPSRGRDRDNKPRATRWFASIAQVAAATSTPWSQSVHQITTIVRKEVATKRSSRPKEGKRNELLIIKVWVNEIPTVSLNSTKGATPKNVWSKTGSAAQ